MSEYTPITGELRDAMRQWGWFESDGSITFVSSPMPPSIDAEKSLAIIGSDFDRCCDAIDSIHAQLERENADMRMKFVTVNRHAEHVERENASLKAELDRVLGEQENRDGWMELPKDADGVPIRVGDKLRYVDEIIECAAITPKRVYFWREHDMRWTPGINCRHYVPDTWERIIEDAIGEGMARQRNNDSGNFCERANPMNNGDLVARCKALCERTKEDA